jgi:hypothetical protein
MGGLIRSLLREKRHIFAEAGRSTDAQLRMLLELTNEDVGTDDSRLDHGPSVHG